MELDGMGKDDHFSIFLYNQAVNSTSVIVSRSVAFRFPVNKYSLMKFGGRQADVDHQRRRRLHPHHCSGRLGERPLGSWVMRCHEGHEWESKRKTQKAKNTCY